MEELTTGSEVIIDYVMAGVQLFLWLWLVICWGVGTQIKWVSRMLKD